MEDEDKNKNNWLDTVHDITEGLYVNTSNSQEVGSVNLVSDADLKKIRNKQLIISVIMISIIVGAAIWYYKKNKK